MRKWQTVFLYSSWKSQVSWWHVYERSECNDFSQGPIQHLTIIAWFEWMLLIQIFLFSSHYRRFSENEIGTLGVLGCPCRFSIMYDLQPFRLLSSYASNADSKRVSQSYLKWKNNHPVSLFKLFCQAFYKPTLYRNENVVNANILRGLIRLFYSDKHHIDEDNWIVSCDFKTVWCTIHRLIRSSPRNLLWHLLFVWACLLFQPIASNDFSSNVPAYVWR